jgi:uncharacterized integral membrane protein
MEKFFDHAPSLTTATHGASRQGKEVVIRRLAGAHVAGRPHPFHLTGRASPAKQSATTGHTASPLRRRFFTVTLASPLIAMGFKTFLRIVVFLAMLFVLIYVAMNNTQPIAFSFPMAFAKGISEPAVYIYFGIFAIGVIAGAMLNFGGGKKSSAKGEKK